LFIFTKLGEVERERAGGGERRVLRREELEEQEEGRDSRVWS
jgi:hypothetical protein